MEDHVDAARPTETEFAATWYHGSPLELSMLRAGSTITQLRELARVFSHKPPMVQFELDDRGRLVALMHSGVAGGWLYRIAEPIGAVDVYPHPRTAMPPGWEWLTRRDLRLELIGPMTLVKSELLTEHQIAELQKKRTHS